jgi:hypothetical protein
MHYDDQPAREFPPIETRRDGENAWSTVVPLLLLGMLATMLLRSCIA